MSDPSIPIPVPTFPGEQIIVLLLEIVLEAMRGQSEEQRKEMWQIYLDDLKLWRKFLKIGESSG